MKIRIAKSAGFCFGVKRAIDIALNTISLDKETHMLGDIVHNEDVARQISQAGIIKVNKLVNGRGKIFIVRAHGAPKSIYRKVSAAGYKIVDATCPMVKEIHKIARGMERKKHTIIVIGDKNHDEVRGITGQLKRKTIVIHDIKDISQKKIKSVKRACVVVQSTQNIEKAQAIVDNLRAKIPHLKFFNTICKPTRIRQEEIRKMPLDNDVMIIIGSKNSANTKRLFEISKSLNRRTYWINSKGELKKSWFKKASSAGITAGASTPESTTRSIIERIHGYS